MDFSRWMLTGWLMMGRLGHHGGSSAATHAGMYSEINARVENKMEIITSKIRFFNRSMS